jgi:hypothetical protein
MREKSSTLDHPNDQIFFFLLEKGDLLCLSEAGSQKKPSFGYFRPLPPERSI